MTQPDAITKAEEGLSPSIDDAEVEEEVAQPKTSSKERLYSKKSSLLAVSDDPFAPREGKTLLWRNVNMILVSSIALREKMFKCTSPITSFSSNSHHRKERQQANQRKSYLIMCGAKCLRNRPLPLWDQGRFLHVNSIVDRRWIPPSLTLQQNSGAGKTSLLNILAGRAASRGRVQINADVRLNNFKVDPTDITVRKHIAFVAQDDSLQVTSTPREAIYFSAKLRLPRNTPEKNLTKLVNKMLKELGLEQCADTYVGGALLKGISGGERKRTSVGVELVVRPAMVFLDEPTSGLDSFSAVQLCQVLKKVANAGSSVLFTIHQPSSEIFNSFDSLILMNKGKVMYNGPVPNVADFFADRGHPLPPMYNPADWIMNVAQSVPFDELNQKGFFLEDDRKLQDAFTGHLDGKDELGITLTERHGAGDFDDRPVGVCVQISMLFSRELKNLRRDTVAVMTRFGLTIFLSVLVGVIFLDVGKADSAQRQVRPKYHFDLRHLLGCHAEFSPFCFFFFLELK